MVGVILSILTLALVAAPGTAAPAQTASYLVQASASFQRLGDYWVSDNPRYQGAIDSLGESSACHLVDGIPTAATAVWRPLGVRMSLATFGGMPAGETGCSRPDLIWISTIRVTGKRWYTSRKLRVGDSVTRLRRLYSKAIASKGVPGWYGRGYWLVTRRQICIGDCGSVRWETAPVLVAETRGGRVSSIVFVVGAQGD